MFRTADQKDSRCCKYTSDETVIKARHSACSTYTEMKGSCVTPLLLRHLRVAAKDGWHEMYYTNTPFREGLLTGRRWTSIGELDCARVTVAHNSTAVVEVIECGDEPLAAIACGQAE